MSANVFIHSGFRVGEEPSTCLIPSNATNVDADIDVITERSATHQLGRVPVAWKMTRWAIVTAWSAKRS
jgi:hypothetical protein